MKFTKSDKFEVLISNMTNSFSSSSPKIIKSGTFSPKLKNFCTKLCNKTNKRTQIPNMTILFSNSSTKISTQSRIFGPKFRHFCFFHEILQVDKFRVLVSNMIILFSNSSPKISTQGIFGPIFRRFSFFPKFCN